MNTSDVPWMTQHLKAEVDRRPFKNAVLNQLSLSSTITQLTASKNHVKISSLKPRYKA